MSDGDSRLRKILAQTSAGKAQLRRADRIMAAEDEAGAIPLKISKGFADLSVRTQNTLLNAGFRTERDVREAHRNGRLVQLPNVGRKRLVEVLQWLGEPTSEWTEGGTKKPA